MRMTTVGALGALQRQRHVLDHQRQREVLADGLVLYGGLALLLVGELAIRRFNKKEEVHGDAVPA